jgi:hypothetical protein
VVDELAVLLLEKGHDAETTPVAVLGNKLRVRAWGTSWSQAAVF